MDDIRVVFRFQNRTDREVPQTGLERENESEAYN